MNTTLLFTAIALLILGIFSIAASSIGTECYNKHESYKTEKKSNFDFLVVNLVSAIVMVLLAFVSIYMSFKMY